MYDNVHVILGPGCRLTNARHHYHIAWCLLEHTCSPCIRVARRISGLLVCRRVSEHGDANVGLFVMCLSSSSSPLLEFVWQTIVAQGDDMVRFESDLDVRKLPQIRLSPCSRVVGK